MRTLRVGTYLVIISMFISCGDIVKVPIKSDSTEADSTEADSTEADSTEADSTEADTTEADTAEADTAEADTAEADTVLPPEPNATAALKTGVQVVKTYIDNDLEAFLAFLSPIIHQLGTDNQATKEEVAANMGAKTLFPAGKDYSAYTLADYNKIYDPKVFTWQEAVKKFDINITSGWTPGANDFVFVGGDLLPGVDKSSAFLWDDLLYFILRQVKGEYRIIGFFD